ncbi:hypothetical protein FACS1894162_8580 [Bacteroidia bacterium]|nr:hypothetical protein FACS1894162_8580 [Bacteroidia bacterium]
MENKIVLYQTEQGNVTVNVVFRDESFWLTQKAMAELFGVEIPAVSKHLKNIYDDGELSNTSTISKMEIVQNEGERTIKRMVDFYNLDAIIAVGYRVNSKKATHFRIWATQTLKEYIIKGFVLNDEMLKNGKPLMLTRPNCFMQLCKTSCILLLPDKQLLKLFIPAQIEMSEIWDFLHGRKPRKEK